MFAGEMEGLLALEKTGCIRVPHPEQIVDYPDKKGAMLVMEYLDIGGGGRHVGKELGEKIAK
jgi:fructosamine-3-kinase